MKTIRIVEVVSYPCGNLVKHFATFRCGNFLNEYKGEFLQREGEPLTAIIGAEVNKYGLGIFKT